MEMTVDHLERTCARRAWRCRRQQGWQARGGSPRPRASRPTWDRSAIGVHVSRFFTHVHLTIDDHATGTSWEYKGNPLYKVGGKLVAALLADPDEA
jgi:hypothetical protein